MTHIRILLCAWALIRATAAAPPPPATEGVTVVLDGATLIDGAGGRPRRHAVVTVRDGRILSVERQGAPPPAGARVIDMTGMWLMPGLIDMHAHVTILPQGDDGRLLPRPDPAATREALRLMLAMGVTTARNPAAPAAAAVELREEVASGRLIGPRIFTAGDSLDVPEAALGAPAVGVATIDEVRAEVRRQAGIGVDFIKVYAALPPALVRAAIEEAHARGLRVIGHLQETTWTQAARDGIDAITHGAPWSVEYLPPGRRAAYREFGAAVRGRISWLEWVDLRGPEIREMLGTLAGHRVTIDPTLIAYHTKFWGDDPEHMEDPDLPLAPALIRRTWRPGWLAWSPREFRRARAAWPKVQALVRMYRQHGIALTAGSDSPNPWVVPGAGLHQELRLLVEAGIPPREVLSMATAAGARALGILDDVGTIEPGKRADLVALHEDPIARIGATRRIAWVMKDGVMHRPEDLL